jgi:hypothetical protein
MDSERPLPAHWLKKLRIASKHCILPVLAKNGLQPLQGQYDIAASFQTFC